jgi:hypothetical protein
MVEEAEAEEEEREKLERERNPFDNDDLSSSEEKPSPSSKKHLSSSFSSSFSSPTDRHHTSDYSYGFPHKQPRYSLFPLQDSTNFASSLPHDSTIPSSVSFNKYSSVDDIVLSSPTDSPTPSLSNAPSLLSLGTNLTREIHSLLLQSSSETGQGKPVICPFPSTSSNTAFPIIPTSATTTASSLTPFPSFEDSIKVLNQIKLLKVLLGKCIHYASMNNIEFFSSLTNKHQSELLISHLSALRSRAGDELKEEKDEEGVDKDNDDIIITEVTAERENGIYNNPEVDTLSDSKQDDASSSKLQSIKPHDYDTKISQLKCQSYQLSECIQSLVNEIMKLNHQYEVSLQHQYHAIYQHKQRL